jgi:hypothetical protein
MIPQTIRNTVIRQWLSGISRNKVSECNQIGAGTVSAIIKECRQKDLDVDLLREVAVTLRRENIDVTTFADSVRLKRRLDRDWNLSEEIIESLIEKINVHCFKRQLKIQDFIEKLDNVTDLSTNLGVPVDNLAVDITQKKNELNLLTKKVQELKNKFHQIVLDYGLTIDDLEEYRTNRPLIDYVNKLENNLQKAIMRGDQYEMQLFTENYQWIVMEPELELLNKQLPKPININDLVPMFWQMS